jgi:hypothetical protein
MGAEYVSRSGFLPKNSRSCVVLQPKEDHRLFLKFVHFPFSVFPFLPRRFPLRLPFFRLSGDPPFFPDYAFES